MRGSSSAQRIPCWLTDDRRLKVIVYCVTLINMNVLALGTRSVWRCFGSAAFRQRGIIIIIIGFGLMNVFKWDGSRRTCASTNLTFNRTSISSEPQQSVWKWMLDCALCLCSLTNWELNTFPCQENNWVSWPEQRQTTRKVLKFQWCFCLNEIH